MEQDAAARGSFEALAESAPDAILTIDPSSTILTANPAVERIFGYKPAELVGRKLTMLIPERMRQQHDAGIARYLRSGKPNIPWTGVRLPALHKTGREFPVEISFGEFTDDQGTHVFSGFVRDLTDRERERAELDRARAEADLARRELDRVSRIIDAPLGARDYERMLDELLAGLRDELHADSAALMLLAENRRELVVQAAVNLPAELSALRLPLGRGVSGRVAQSGEPLIVADTRTEGTASVVLGPNAVSAAAVPIKIDGEVIGVLAAGSRDVAAFDGADLRLIQLVAERMAGVFARTRIFRLEQRHGRNERVMRKLAQAITGAVRVNEIMQQIAEGALAVSDATGAYVEQVIDVEKDIEVVAAVGSRTPPLGTVVAYPGSLTEEIIEQREPMFLIRMEGLGKSMAPYLTRDCAGCSVLVVPIFAEKQVLGTLALLREPEEEEFEQSVVDRVRVLADLASIALQRLASLAESERRRSEAEAAVRARDDVLSIVSHDLRNPVSTVAMSAALLNDPDMRLSPEQQRMQFGIIARSAERMNRLIQDLLDVARIEGNRLRISKRCDDPGAIAREACESFRAISRDRGLELECQLAEGLPATMLDRDRVIQALSNYLNNAIKFAPRDSRVVLSATAANGAVRFSVTDAGPGIDRSEISQVFKRFWQARRTAHMGSGLGLAIVAGIAEAHDGKVWVESEPRIRTTFYLEIPAIGDC